MRPTEKVRPLSWSQEPQYGTRVYIRKAIPEGGWVDVPLPAGLAGVVASEAKWLNNDLASWRERGNDKTFCLVTFQGRGTYSIPVEYLALS